MPDRILVVEDDLDIQRMLTRSLAQEGYEVAAAGDGIEALKVASDWRPDLMILDVMLPQLDGLAVCERVRRQLDIPVVMLTAKNQLDDRLAGLEVGADDYIVKPFALQELLMRLKVQLRHRQRPTNLRYGDLALDLDERVVRVGERTVPLTTTEFLLVRTLLESPGEVQSRARLHEAVWGDDGDVNSNLLEVYIARLRRKLDTPNEPPRVQTVRGVGYVIPRLIGPTSAVGCGWRSPAALASALHWRRGSVGSLTHLPAAARRYLGLVICAGPAYVVLLLNLDAGLLPEWFGDAGSVIGGLLLFGLTLWLGTLAVHLGPQRKASGASVGGFAAVLTLPPGLAAVAVGLAALFANMILKRPWYNSLFNASQHAIAAGTAAATYVILTQRIAPTYLSVSSSAPIAFLLPGAIVTVVALVHVGLSSLLTAGIISAKDHRLLPLVWFEVLKDAAWVETGWLAAGAALVYLGRQTPILAPLALVPVWTLYRMGRELVATNQRVARLEGGVAGQARFVQDAAHELRSPLTALRGNLDLLGSDPRLPAENRQLVADLQSQAERLSRLATDLLLLAQLEQAPHPRRILVDLVEVVADVVAQRPAAAEWPVQRLELDVVEEANVAGDPEQLTRVFVNLIENAIRHTPPEGRVRVRIGLDKTWIVTEVSDTGCGIDPADLPRIFERFYRGRARAPLGPGSGLGLAIVREIVTAHGGQITVDAQPEHGARFVVRLPVA